MQEMGFESKCKRWDLNPRPSVILPDALITELLETLRHGDEVWTVGLWLELYCAVTQPNEDETHLNSLAASRSHIKAYQRCNQPTSLVNIITRNIAY